MNQLFQPGRLNWRDAAFIAGVIYVIVLAVRIIAVQFLHLDKIGELIVGTYIQDLLIIFLVGLVLHRIHHTSWKRINLVRISPEVALICFLIGMVLLFIVNAAMGLIDEILPKGVPPQNVEAMMHLKSPLMSFLISFVTMTILAPIAEEIFFRGYIYEALCSDYGSRIAMAVTSILFGFVHADIYRFVPLVIVGYVFNLVAVRWNSIIASMVVHATWNGVSVMAAFLHLVPK